MNTESRTEVEITLSIADIIAALKVKWPNEFLLHRLDAGKAKVQALSDRVIVLKQTSTISVGEMIQRRQMEVDPQAPIDPTNLLPFPSA